MPRTQFRLCTRRFFIGESICLSHRRRCHPPALSGARTPEIIEFSRRRPCATALPGRPFHRLHGWHMRCLPYISLLPAVRVSSALPCNLLSRHFSHVFGGAFQRSLWSYARKQIENTSDNARPSRLMAGAQPGAVVAMEVLVEQDVILPVRIFLEFFRTSINRALAAGVAQEDARQSPGNLFRHLK